MNSFFHTQLDLKTLIKNRLMSWFEPHVKKRSFLDWSSWLHVGELFHLVHHYCWYISLCLSSIIQYTLISFLLIKNINIIFVFLTGVLFTRHPVTSDPSIMIINANYGLGEVSVTLIYLSCCFFTRFYRIYLTVFVLEQFCLSTGLLSWVNNTEPSLCCLNDMPYPMSCLCWYVCILFRSVEEFYSGLSKTWLLGSLQALIRLPDNDVRMYT